MSGDSTQGVGAAAWAKAETVSAAGAAAIKKAAIKNVLTENRVIPHPPHAAFEKIEGRPVLNKSRTSSFRQYDERRAGCGVLRLCDFPLPTSRLSSLLEPGKPERGMIRMNQFMKTSFAGALMVVTLAGVAKADDFKLSNNQRIACSRGLSAGKLNTATCKSYAYIFNVKTSEYFRCSVSLALTRDNKEVINVQTDGGCTKKPRIFETDSNYSFDATETEPPNTNSFFGPGGYAIWASDNTAQKVRGCITISSGLGSDISKCLDMAFQ
jgi:hypothetical protein